MAREHSFREAQSALYQPLTALWFGGGSGRPCMWAARLRVPALTLTSSLTWDLTVLCVCFFLCRKEGGGLYCVSHEQITVRHLAQNLAHRKFSVTGRCHGSVTIGARWWPLRAGGLGSQSFQSLLEPQGCLSAKPTSPYSVSLSEAATFHIFFSLQVTIWVHPHQVRPQTSSRGCPSRRGKPALSCWACGWGQNHRDGR